MLRLKQLLKKTLYYTNNKKQSAKIKFNSKFILMVVIKQLRENDLDFHSICIWSASSPHVGTYARM